MRRTALPCLAALTLLPGCVERRIEITSEPSGAMVWVNDQQVGRTPTAAAFLYHGVYDVRLHLDGYEPLATEAEAEPPFYEHAPLDFAAEVIPARIRNVQRWHFVLTPALEQTLERPTLEADLLARADAMRTKVEQATPPEPAAEGTPPTDPGP